MSVNNEVSADQHNPELEDDTFEHGPPVSLGEKKSLNEYMKMDAEDESLQKWKASLGITGTGYSPSNDRRTVVILKLSLLVDGRDPVDVNMEDAASIEQIRKKGFTIKEGSEFKIGVKFRVQHEVISGLRYVQTVRRRGFVVDKTSTMIGSYGPSETPYDFTSEPDEAPTGMLARGHYEANGKFVDDDKVVHHEFVWAFDVAKSWK